MPEILSFPFFGPNRHSDKRVVECRMDFSKEARDEFPHNVSDICLTLLKNGIIGSEEGFPQSGFGASRIDWYTSLFAQTALLLQSKGGHRVKFFSVTSDEKKNSSIALLEHEDSEAAMAAIGLTGKIFSARNVDLRAEHQKYLEFSRSRCLSDETVAIIDSARRQNIPVFQLDRVPLGSRNSTEFCVQRNGFLSLGHGANCIKLDGTFCLSKANDYLRAMLRNPDQRVALLRQLGMHVPKAAPAIGDTDGELNLLVINSRITAVLNTPTIGKHIIRGVHESLRDQVRTLAEKVAFQPLILNYHVEDAKQPMTSANCHAQGFELGPDLNKLFQGCTSARELISGTADQIINWLFPEPADARIPMVAVTGTNGKTTTGRMLHQIFNHRGFNTALVCTDGIILNKHQVLKKDAGTYLGHVVALTNPTINAAVLETHHRGIALHGFAFRKCDVGICLNVTEEHIADNEVQTVEEMAVIKRALVERAEGTAILFADNDHCRGMIPHLNSNTVCLVSLVSTINELQPLLGNSKAAFCVLEKVGEQQWIVIHQDQARIAVMPVGDVPATFDGTAGFNVSNVMHAIAAAHFSGIEVSSIRAALKGFNTSSLMTPGRMNVFDKLPFTMILDFAHNMDGVQKICEFADLQNVKGSKIIAIAGTDKRTEKLNRKVAQTIAGHFDFYYCKEYPPGPDNGGQQFGPFMQNVLVESGVPEKKTKVVTYGQDVIFSMMDSCKADDLLILLAGHTEVKTVPGYIKAYRQRLAGREKRGRK